MFIAAKYIPKNKDELNSRKMFQLFYVTAWIFYSSFSLLDLFHHKLFDALVELSLVSGQYFLIVGCAYHSGVRLNKYIPIFISSLFLVLILVADDASLLIGFVYAVVTHLWAAIIISNRKLKNVGDRGMIITLLVWSFLLILSLLSLTYDLFQDSLIFDLAINIFLLSTAFFSSFGVFLIMSKLLDTQKLYEYQANSDSLTGKYNHRFFVKKATKYFASKKLHERPISLIMCDIDFFKRVNDTYGHNAGDKVIKHFSDVLAKEVRTEDILARIGGEEFVVLLEHVELNRALAIAETMRNNTQNLKVKYENSSINITASFGVFTTRGGHSLEDCFKKADSALYKAKDNGRNQVCV